MKINSWEKCKNAIHLLLQQTFWIRCIWYVIPLLAVLIKALQGPLNNYLIYKGVFYHTLQKTNLYYYYPSKYFDKNHYGILFSLVIAPFTLLPDIVSVILYQAIQLFALQAVIRLLPMVESRKNALLLFLLFDAIANCQNVQTNTFIAFVMVGSYIYIYTKQEAKAAFLTILGFFIKLYGIVGLGLFFFVKRKPRYILFLLLSAVVCYCLPLFITNFKFINQSYVDWWVELGHKNGTNSDEQNVHQNMSAIGFFMKLTGRQAFNMTYVVIPAFVLQLLPMIRRRLFHNTQFQLHYLASLMMFIILFNTATETSTYIIGATGAGIWWLTQKKSTSTAMIVFVLFVFLAGTLSTTSLVPSYVNYDIFRKYSLKSIPYLMVWCICIYQLILSKFEAEI